MTDPRSGGPVIKSVEFYNIEPAPLADGRVYVSMLATTVDDQDLQLLTQEIARDTVPDDRRRACRYPTRCSKDLSRPISDPAAVAGRTTKSRRQSRPLLYSKRLNGTLFLVVLQLSLKFMTRDVGAVKPAHAR